MVTSTGIFLVALVCGVVCNPLGQTTLRERQNRLNGLLQALGPAAVCDATPNLLGMGYGLGLNLSDAPYLSPYLNGLGSTTASDTLPNIGLNPLSPFGISPGYGSTCESIPNLGLGLSVGLEGLGGLGGLGPIVPGPTTVIERTSNLGLGIGGIGYGGLDGLGALVPSFTTICESTPNLGLGIGGIGYGELGGLDANVGLGYPYSIPRYNRFGSGLGYGYHPHTGLGGLSSVAVL